MDTMTGTKIVGALCGTFLVLLLGKFFAETIYHVGGHGHGDHHAQAYVIDTGEDHGGDEAEEEVVPFAEVFAAADADAGEKVFRKCSSCHQLEAGKNAAGPYLHGVVGRAVASASGFSGYKGAFPDETWTPEALNGFLENPKAYAEGTSMNFKGLPKVEDRANLIAYLATFN